MQEYIEAINLVDKVEDIDKVKSDLDGYYQEADSSMEDWNRKFENAIKLVTLKCDEGQKNFPIENASTVMSPFVLEAAMDFHSRSVADLVYSPKLVNAKINGAPLEFTPTTPEEEAVADQIEALLQAEREERENRAERVSTYMNYQLTRKIPSWRKTQDKLLLQLPTVGTVFKKVYYDPDIKGVRSEMVRADKLKFDHSADDFADVRHKFLDMELSKSEVISRIRGDEWDIEETELSGDDECYKFYEALTWIDIDGDGLEEPYVCVYWVDRSKIVSIKANYDEDCITYNDNEEIVNIEPIDYYLQYIFMPDPAGGCMGMGWGILLSDIFESINTNLRQLIDAGTLSNIASNSGFIDVGLGGKDRQQSGTENIEMGRFKKVQLPAGKSMRESIVQLPFQGVQPALFQLMEYLVNQARNLTVSAYGVEANSGEAAQLYLARLQQGLKQPNSIIMRVYECATDEFTRIAKLNYEHYDNDYYSKVLNIPADMQRDFNYEDCDITPVANPHQGSDVERIAKAQAVYEMSQTNQSFNQWQAARDLLDAMGVSNIDEVLPEPDPNYQDPMQTMLMQQKAAEMELYNRELTAKERKVAIDELKVAMDYEAMLADLDKTESETTKNYADVIEKMAKVSRESAMDAMSRISAIEESFFRPAEGGNDDERRDGDMVRRESNQAIPLQTRGIPPSP